MTTALAIVASYLLGSIPFGLLLGFWAGKDIRLLGSKNIGATNVYRVCGRWWGIAAFALDFLKGLAATTLIPKYLPLAFPGHYPVIVCAFAVVLGHIFPVWLGFRGGKGVATSAGAVAGLMWLPFLLAFASFIAVVAWLRYISLGSMTASIVLLICTTLLLPEPMGYDFPLVVLAAALCALIIVRHRQNIVRIIDGTENRFPPPKPGEEAQKRHTRQHARQRTVEHVRQRTSALSGDELADGDIEVVLDEEVENPRNR